MKTANPLHEIINKTGLFPLSNLPLFTNINLYADLFFSSRMRLPLSLPRLPKAKTSKKTSHSSARHQTLQWYFYLNRDANPSPFPLPLHRFLPPLGIMFSERSPTQKKAATAIKNPNFLQNFTKCLALRTPTTEFNLESGKSIESLAPISDAFFDYLLSQLKVAVCSEPVLYLTEEAVEKGDFLLWLDRITNSKLFEYNCEGEDNLLWFSSKTFRPLSHHLANQIEKHVGLYYYQNRNPLEEIKELKEFFRHNGKGSLEEALEVPLMEFMVMGEKEVAKIQEKVRIEEDRLHSMKAEKLFLQMERNGEKAKKNKRKAKKKVVYTQKQANSAEIQQRQQDSPSSAQVQDMATSPVQQEIKKQSEQLKEAPIFTPVEQVHEPQVLLVHMEENECIPQTSSQNMEQTHSNEISTLKSQCTCHEQETSHSQQLTHDHFIESDVLKSQKTRKRRRRKGKKDIEAFQILKQQMCHKFMTRELENISETINSSTNKILQARVMAFQRVRIFIQNNYPFSNAILFGSNAIGLALPASDVDLLLTGFSCTSRTDSGQLLNHIGYLISCMGWVLTCEVYSNAKVPVMKLQVDTSVPFMQLKGSNHPLYNSNEYYSLQSEKEKIVKVDITVNVQGVSSAGYESTLLMKKWLENYPFAQKIIILFKHILAYRHLNENYRGGVGSYCLFVMVVAYIHQHSISPEIELSRLFLDLLVWYSEGFNNEKYIIWLREQGSCFESQEEYHRLFGQSEQRKSLLRIVDPTTCRVMSGSCSEYVKIKCFFKEILDQLTSIQEKVLQQISLLHESASQVVKMFQNKRQSERWLKNTNEKHGWALKGLLGMLG